MRKKEDKTVVYMSALDNVSIIKIVILKAKIQLILCDYLEFDSRI